MVNAITDVKRLRHMLNTVLNTYYLNFIIFYDNYLMNKFDGYTVLEMFFSIEACTGRNADIAYDRFLRVYYRLY